jgi:hypothetical protein
MLPHTECNANDREGEAKRDLIRAEELRNVSKIFFKSLTNVTLTNPAYWLHKAYAYEQIDSQQSWLNNVSVTEDGKKQIKVRGKYILPEEESTLFNSILNTASGLVTWATGGTSFKALRAGFVPVSDAYVNDALSQAYEFSYRASIVDSFYNWWGKNALAYFTLIKDSPTIIDAKEDGQRAVNVLKAFANHQNAAAHQLTLYTQLLEGYLEHMLLQNFTHRTSDFAIQKKSEIELLKCLVRFMVINVDKVRSIFANFKKRPSILEVSGVIAGSELMKFVYRATIMEFYNYGEPNTTLEENVFNISDIENFAVNITEAQADMMKQSNLANHSVFAFNFTSLTKKLNDSDIDALLAPIINELSAAGAIAIVTSARRLEQQKHWIGTVFSIVLGAIQIAAGIALLGPALFAAAPAAGAAAGGGIGVFTSAFATATIAAGIVDIIGGVVSIAKGVPIDVYEYFKSKAVGLL